MQVDRGVPLAERGAEDEQVTGEHAEVRLVGGQPLDHLVVVLHPPAVGVVAQAGLEAAEGARHQRIAKAAHSLEEAVGRLELARLAVAEHELDARRQSALLDRVVDRGHELERSLPPSGSEETDAKHAGFTSSGRAPA